MSERHLLYSLLTDDAAVTAVYQDRIIDAGELGGTPGIQPEFPFLAVKFAESLPGASSRSRRHSVELWSYGEDRDYTVLAQGLDAIFALLDHRHGGPVTADGVTTWLIEAKWESTSRDLRDDVLRASVRYATYTLVTNTQ